MAQSVKYDTPVKGIGYVRTISAAEWKAAGAEDQGKTIWSAENNYMVPVSELNAQALEILKEDPDMKFVGQEAPSEPVQVTPVDTVGTAPDGGASGDAGAATGRTGTTGGNTSGRGR